MKFKRDRMMNFKKMIRNILALLLVMVLACSFNTVKPKAADVSISIALSSSSVSVGSGVTATISVNGGSISAYTMYVSYDSGVLQYNSGSGATINGGGGTVIVSGTSAGSVSLSFTALKNGSSSIATSGSDFLDIDGNTLSVSHAGVTVSVATAQQATTQAPANSENNTGNNSSNNTSANNTEAAANGEDASTTSETTEEDNRSDNCKLSNLQISPGILEPAFSPDTTSYQVQVDEDVTSMVVSATPADDKATTQVWGAGLIEPGENTVKITVTAENGAVKVYNIRVLAGEDKGEANVTIDDEFYKFADNQNVDGIPDGFSDTTITYKDWEVLAFKSPNKKLTIVCLIDVEGELKWFIYDEATDEFSPYQEFSSKYNRYIIMAVPEDSEYLESFELTEVDIDGNKVQALRSDLLNDADLYIVYAMNIEGDEAYYLYDKSEGTFMRYVAPAEEEEEEVTATVTDIATVTDVPDTEPSEPKNNTLLYVSLVIAGILAVVFFILFLVMLTKCNSMKDRAQEAEDMVDSLGGGKGVDSSLLNKREGKSSSTINLENLQNPQNEEEGRSDGKIELPKGRRKDKKTSFVDAVNNMEPIKFGENTADGDMEEITMDEAAVGEASTGETAIEEMTGEIPAVDLNLGDSVEISYKPDEKEENFRKYEDESELINNRIMEGYNVDSDSAFPEALSTETETENKPEDESEGETENKLDNNDN